MLPHPQPVERSDRPQRGNGLQRGISPAFFVAGKLAGKRSDVVSGSSRPGPVARSERPLAPVPFLSEFRVVLDTLICWGGSSTATPTDQCASYDTEVPMPLYPLGISRSRDIQSVPKQSAGAVDMKWSLAGRAGLRFHRRSAPCRPTDASCGRFGSDPSPHQRVAGPIRRGFAR